MTERGELIAKLRAVPSRGSWDTDPELMHRAADALTALASESDANLRMAREANRVAITQWNRADALTGSPQPITQSEIKREAK